MSNKKSQHERGLNFDFDELMNIVGGAVKDAVMDLAKKCENIQDYDRIIMIGAHGTGKSTLANELGKLTGVTVVESIAREMRNVFDRMEIPTGAVNDTHKQDALCHLALWDFLRWKDEDVIMTRCPLDTLAYTMATFAAHDWSKSPDIGRKYLSIIEKYTGKMTGDAEVLEMFENSLFVYLPIEFDIENDGVRPVDKKYQELVDISLRQLMSAFGIKPLVVSGTVQERVEQFVTATLGDELGKYALEAYRR